MSVVSGILKKYRSKCQWLIRPMSSSYSVKSLQTVIIEHNTLVKNNILATIASILSRTITASVHIFHRCINKYASQLDAFHYR